MDERKRSRRAGNVHDVVDGDVNKLNEEADETHDGKADSDRQGDLHELYTEVVSSGPEEVTRQAV